MSKSNKIIAISTAISEPGKLESAGFGVKNQRHSVLDTDYTNAIAAAGALPLPVPASACAAHIAQFAELADGLLLTGGQDISPRIYGEAISADCGPISAARDAYEIALLRAFYERKKPIFGICRGLQLLNAFFGGTLHQHLPAAGFAGHSITAAERYDAVHTVAAEGWLAAALGENRWVNSFHHQGIKALAPGAVALAAAPDGLIEAFELRGDCFVAAVQWHPEMMLAGAREASWAMDASGGAASGGAAGGGGGFANGGGAANGGVWRDEAACAAQLKIFEYFIAQC